MQNEASVYLYRPAKVDGQAAATLVAQRNVDLLEQGLQRHVDRSIHHNAQGSLLVVLTNVSERFGEVGIDHARHGDQKVVGKVHGPSAWKKSRAYCRRLRDPFRKLRNNRELRPMPRNRARLSHLPEV